MKENNHSINRNFGKIFVIISFFCLFLISFSSAKTIEISTCVELQNIQDNLTADYVLVNDIDCSETKIWNNGNGFIPIGYSTSLDYNPTSSTAFEGNFDGKNYTISGLYINRPTQRYIGLFGFVKNANISNLRINNSEIIGQYSVGGLVGYSGSSSSIFPLSLNILNVFLNNCTIRGDSWVGGMVGRSNPQYAKYNLALNISNSYFRGEIIGDHYVGGLLGLGYGNGYGCGSFFISRSFFSGNLSADTHFGGLVGYSGAGSLSILDSYASGNLNFNLGRGDSFTLAGGLIGGTDCFVTLLNTYFVGEVNGKSYPARYDNTGGLIGSSYSPRLSILNSYSSSNIESNNYAGGLIGYGSAIVNNTIKINNSYYFVPTDLDCAFSKSFNGCNSVELQSYFFNYSNSPYTSWDFENIWDKSNEGKCYPTLQGMPSFTADVCNLNPSYSTLKKVNSVYWSHFLTGKRVSSVLNSTLVNLVLEGNFSIGEVFNYSIYLDKSWIKTILTFSGDEKIYSGIHIVTYDEVSSGKLSISWNAIWNGTDENPSKYYFKIIGNKDEIISDNLEVLKETINHPTETEIVSPLNKEIYTKNEIISLLFNVTEQHAPLNSIKYVIYNDGNINSQGNEFSLTGEQDFLLNASVNVSFTSSGQKEIVLYTTDSLGNVWKSKVFILVLQDGINVFSNINSPEDNSNNYNSKIQFNGLSSYILNSTENSVICVAGDCPVKLNEKSSVLIDSSNNNFDNNLASSDIFFNWSWKGVSEKITGTGLDKNISVFEKFESLGLNKEVSLLLTYLNVSSLSSNDYNVISSETYCLNGKWMNGISPVSISYGGTVDSCRLSSFETCCPAGQICNSTNSCETTSRTSCFEYNSSKEDCEYNSNFYSANKSVYNSVRVSCGEIVYSNGSIIESVENCKCVWDETDKTCGVSYDLESVNSEDVFSIGTCSIFVKNIVDSCSDNGFISRTYVGNWSWDSLNLEEIDFSNQHINCTTITRSIVCPTEIELPFFGIVGFIVAIGIIFGVYYLFRNKKFKHAKRF